MNPRSLLLFIISAVSLVNGAAIRDTPVNRDLADTSGASTVSAQPASGCPIDAGPPPAPNPNSAFSVPHPPAKCEKANVRQEWRTLTRSQQTSWVNAVKCLTTKPRWAGFEALGQSPNTAPYNRSSFLYDDFVYLHLDQQEWVHLTGFFFIFHRLYVFTFDLALRQRCGYTGPTPYWDWSKDAADFATGTIWNSNTEYGLGTLGNPNADWAVTDGAFASGFTTSYPFPHQFRRQLTLEPFDIFFFPEEFQTEIANSTFTPALMNAAVQSRVGDYPNFQHDFEKLWGAHGSVHGIVGGDLGGNCPPGGNQSLCGNFQFSPNEPMFWLHHGNVDRLYYSWQKANPQNFWTFSGGSVQSSWPFNVTTTEPNGVAPWLNYTSMIPNDNLLPNARVIDVIDTQGGFLCYTYDTTEF